MCTYFHESNWTLQSKKKTWKKLFHPAAASVMYFEQVGVLWKCPPAVKSVRILVCEIFRCLDESGEAWWKLLFKIALLLSASGTADSTESLQPRTALRTQSVTQITQQRRVEAPAKTAIQLWAHNGTSYPSKLDLILPSPFPVVLNYYFKNLFEYLQICCEQKRQYSPPESRET